MAVVVRMAMAPAFPVLLVGRGVTAEGMATAEPVVPAAGAVPVGEAVPAAGAVPAVPAVLEVKAAGAATADRAVHLA